MNTNSVSVFDRRMKFENGSASPVVLDVKYMPPGGQKLDAIRVERTRDGEFYYSRFESLDEALRVRGMNSWDDIEWGMKEVGYRRVG